MRLVTVLILGSCLCGCQPKGMSDQEIVQFNTIMANVEGQINLQRESIVKLTEEVQSVKVARKIK